MSISGKCFGPKVWGEVQDIVDENQEKRFALSLPLIFTFINKRAAMIQEEITDFIEDIHEGQAITLLLFDDTQETGKVVKIRQSSVKLLLEESGIELSIRFEDVKRYSSKPYNFLRPQSALVPSALLAEHQAPPVFQPQAESQAPATAPTPPVPASKDPASLMQTMLASFDEKLKNAAMPDIEPKFDFDSTGCGFAKEKEIKNILSAARQKYEEWVKSGDTDTLAKIIGWLEERLAKNHTIAALPTLIGTLLWKSGQKPQSIVYFKVAAHISKSSLDWRNLAIAACDNGEISFFAWHNYFTFTNVFGVEENLWLLYTRAARASHAERSIIGQTLKIRSKVKDKEQKNFLDSSLVWLLHAIGRDNEAMELVCAQDNEAKVNAILSSLEKYFSQPPARESDLQKNREYDLLDAYEKIFRIVVSPVHPQVKSPIYSTEFASGSAHRGHVVAYSPFLKGGQIKSKETGETFFFYLGMVEDEKVQKNIQNGVFTDFLQFSTFVNAKGLRQAKKIKLFQDIDFTNGDYRNDREVEKNAKKAILSGMREKAIAIYRQGLKQTQNETSSVLWVGLAQQLSAVGQYDEAADAYRQLIKIEHRPAARKNANVQYIQVLVKAGKREMAEKELVKLLKEDPHDAYLSKFLENLRLYDKIGENGQGSLEDWGTDLQEISQFLRRELESADFLDTEIVRRGGKPTPEDAYRLKEAATEPGKSPDQRYFLSLQAAKAYSLLPIGSYSRDDYHESLSNYAMQRGEALVNRMLGLASSPEETAKEKDLLLRLRDSATSYFIESLSWMSPKAVARFAPPVIKNYLLAEVVYFYAENPQYYKSELLKSSSFNSLFTYMLDQDNNLFFNACSSFFTWGSYKEVWRRLRRVKGGPGAFAGKMYNASFTNNVKAAFEFLYSQSIGASDPSGVLREGFDILLKERQALLEAFRKISMVPQTLNYVYFQKIKNALDNFPLGNKSLLASDVDMVKRIQKVVNDMMSYFDASDSERADMLVRARQGLDGPETSLLREISDAPTYWKRVGCEPLIRELLKCIGGMETTRMKDRTPQLEILLEPPLFQREGESLATSMRINNTGMVSATDTHVSLTLSYADESLIELPALAVGRIEAHQSTETKLSLPFYICKENIIGGTLQLKATFSEGYSNVYDFTIEEDRGVQFSSAEIPWNPMGDVPAANFKGRDPILNQLEKCLSSDSDRVFTHMLYGVTRSGKTSILKFLRQRMHGKKVPNDVLGRRFFCVDWRFQNVHELSSSHEVWKSLLYTQVNSSNAEMDIAPQEMEAIEQIVNTTILEPNQTHGEHFLPLMDSMKAAGWYPLFLIDEFSFFRGLYKKGYLGAAFLAMLRELALRKDAAFIIAGTYDILDLVADPQYGITGQFANLRKLKVTEIDDRAAGELVDIFSNYLRFTEGARKLILQLTGCRPFLIQFLCLNCAYLALHERRSLLGVPEVRRVAEMTVGMKEPVGGVIKLEDNNFDNNLIFLQDPMNEVFGGVTSMLALKSHRETGFLSYAEMTSIWRDWGLDVALLAKAIEAMKAREIIKRGHEEEVEGYQLTVELFRWWWAQSHPFLDTALDAISAK